MTDPQPRNGDPNQSNRGYYSGAPITGSHLVPGRIHIGNSSPRCPWGASGIWANKTSLTKNLESPSKLKKESPNKQNLNELLFYQLVTSCSHLIPSKLHKASWGGQGHGRMDQLKPKSMPKVGGNLGVLIAERTWA